MNLGLDSPLSSLLLLLALGGCGAHVGDQRIASPTGSAVLHERMWHDENGHAVAIDDYKGKPFVLTEVYTSCEVRCPMTLDALRKMDTELQSRGIAAEFVLVTLDPRTDTPERLHRWKSARNLGASYHLLSGTESGARALARYLNVNAAYDSGHIDHDVQIALFDASGRETRKYTGWSFDPADMAMGARGAPGGDPMSTGETR